MNELQDPWYVIQDVESIDSPALVVYPDRVAHNIALLKSMIDDPARLRPHIKTHKAIEPVKMMMQAGINKFKCATIAEAEMLGMAGAPDVLLAYQPAGPKLARFVCVVKKYPGTMYACLADNEASASAIAAAFQQEGLTIRVYIDINAGMNRTGIKPGEAAVELYRYMLGFQGVSLVGLHVYDGHIHDPELQVRELQANEVYRITSELVTEITNSGYPEPIVVIGGSPSFPFHSRRPVVECSSGTFIYWDKGYLDSCAEQAFHPAALVVSRVVSLPDDTKVCLDLGHKSIAPENPLGRRVYFLNAPGLLFVSQSEEHLVLDAGAGHTYKPGDIFYGMPYHVCPTVALYERAITVEEGMVTGSWKNIARDRSLGC